MLLLVWFLSVSQVSCQDSTTAIDFSGGEVGEDGVVCVVREEEREKLEQEQEQQCTQQNVTQCYNEYSTVYRDVVREKCTEVYLKTCRIVIRERTYNHTARVCKRPLVKLCDPPVVFIISPDLLYHNHIMVLSLCIFVVRHYYIIYNIDFGNMMNNSDLT